MLFRLLSVFACSILMFASSSSLTLPAHADTSTPQHLLWTKSDGSVAVWTLNSATGQFTSQTFGPYAGWTAKTLSDGSDGLLRILWTHSPDGQVSIWNLDSTGHFTTQTYGPYAGWSAVAMSSLASSTFSGTAGGDLFGLFPNPTIAPGVVDHTKLASDYASLSQVSGGLLTDFDNFHIFVTHDFIVKGTVIAVQGNGGGAGNNNHQGRAIVDDGANGLTINYGNDFGKVNVPSDLNVSGAINTGTLTTSSELVSHGHDFILNGRGGGVGNNGGAGRAMVDEGGDGLHINFANDFGFVKIESDTTVYGSLTANSLQLTGGSDLAEPYKIAAYASVQPIPGMVVSIDPQQTGQMRICTHAYDATVGGIISGANGIQPGVVLRQKGTVADGTLPIACTGRVWCWCDADAGGAIAPGDMLTTSDTPGHAMRVRDHDRAQGAILGKAMSSLRSGKGLVLVLVTLQ